ncbi:hypothetical protein [Streptomyces sp. NPDC029674]|uniref:hypothetical protein n=1 Tax=Streptomyces sp. NPDC029674 TaxID=3365297 RepID=UPI00384EDDF7
MSAGAAGVTSTAPGVALVDTGADAVEQVAQLLGEHRVWAASRPRSDRRPTLDARARLAWASSSQ